MKILGLPNQDDKTNPKPQLKEITNYRGAHSAYTNGDDRKIFVENLDDVFHQVELGHPALAKAKEKIEEAEKVLAQVARDFQMSEATLVGDEFEADVIAKERVTWNTDQLESIFHAADKLPDHVKKLLRVDKEAYEKLPQAMKDILEPARIVNPQKPKINVRRK